MAGSSFWSLPVQFASSPREAFGLLMRLNGDDLHLVNCRWCGQRGAIFCQLWYEREAGNQRCIGLQYWSYDGCKVCVGSSEWPTCQTHQGGCKGTSLWTTFHTRTATLELGRVCLIKTHLLLSPKLCSSFHKAMRSTESKAALKSTKATQSGLWNSFLVLIIMVLSVTIWSIVERPGVKPLCSVLRRAECTRLNLIAKMFWASNRNCQCKMMGHTDDDGGWGSCSNREGTATVCRPIVRLISGGVAQW